MDIKSPDEAPDDDMLELTVSLMTYHLRQAGQAGHHFPGNARFGTGCAGGPRDADRRACGRGGALMGRVTACAALIAMLLMLGCAATAGDLPAPGERIIASTGLREKLATCLDHHVSHAEKIGNMGGNRIAAFAIARCARRSGYFSQDPIIDIDGPWGPATDAELRSCKAIAYADLRPAFRNVHRYTDARRFYVMSVCIPTLGLSH